MEIKTFSDQEIRKFRDETRGTSERIHFNNAGASLPTNVVVDTVIHYLKEEAVYGGYETEYVHRDALDNVYTLIAKLIHAEKSEIAIAENASMAWGLAFNGIDFKKGDCVITSEMEYITNLLGFLHAKEKFGIEIKVISNDENGNFPLSALEAAISPQTKLIAITHVASSSGVVLPVREIGEIARRHGILYLVDACQTVGQMPIDVQEIGCDILAATGRKFLRGPRGTGFLYVRKELRNKLNVFFLDGHTASLISEEKFAIREDGRRFEVFEKNRALTLGLGKAIEYALGIGLGRIWQRIQFLAKEMRCRLDDIEGIQMHDRGDLKCGIVTFSVGKMEASQVKAELAAKKINVSVGPANLTLIYMKKNHLRTMVRASVHYYNTVEEINQMAEALNSLVRSSQPSVAEGDLQEYR